MSAASILFDNRARRLTLEHVRDHLTQANVTCRLGEWTFLGRSLPQLDVQTPHPFALQLNESAEIVASETLEMIEDGRLPSNGAGLSAVLECDARIEVVSGAQPIITHLREGGVVSFTPEADLSAPATQQLLRDLATYLNGTLILHE